MSATLDGLKAALASRYTLEREIGSGGMATVYLASDLRHNRKVALKVLRPELAATMGPERFLHEIEIAAQLQHPNILPLLDSGEAAGFLYYVMPFIEGQTLRDRLLREGELPVPSAVKILSEVVDALAEAHARGVIHRDIKPENVLLTGRHALVADFGVAKAVNEATGRHQLTTAGVALGTPSYMAPEQASAEPHLDARVDIYAVGAMAYEMLTGRPPFTGSSAQQILAAHITQTAEPVSRHRASISPGLEAVVMKCLAKRPSDRWQSAEELLAQLEPILATPSGGVTPTDTRPMTGATAPAPAGSKRMLVIGGVAGVLLVAIAAAVFIPRGEARIEFGPVRPVTTDPGLEMQPALSPDGKTLAYVAGEILHTKVYVRSIAGGTPIEVAKGAPDDQQWPKWSPDGSRLLFEAGGAIQVVPSLGGTARLLVANGGWPAWSPDGSQFAYVANDSVFVRGTDGGTAHAVATALEAHEPAWSPDGKLIAFVTTNSQFDMGTPLLGNLAPSLLMVVPAAGGEVVRLTSRRFLNKSPQWLPDSRHLLFMSTQEGGRDLYEIAVDGRGRARGPAARLTTGLDIGSFSLSADGKQLAWTSFANTANIFSIPIPASGTISEAEAKQVTTGTQHVEGVGVSRDGKWLAFDSDRLGNPDIYIMPIEGGEARQLTTDPSFDFIPSWSYDGKEIAFQSWRNESRDIFVVPAEGGAEQMAVGGPQMEYYPDWSPDGRSIVFQSDRNGTSEIHIVTRVGGAGSAWGEPRQVTRTRGGLPRWSPDGRWIVYFRMGGLRLVRPEGGDPRELVAGADKDERIASVNFAVWDPDAKTIYFKAELTDGHGSFWSVPVTGGKPRLLARFNSPAFAASRQEFATDGKRLFFTADDRQADIKVMELRAPR